MTMNGALQLKSDVNMLYVKRKEGRQGLIGVEWFVKEEENSLKMYVFNCKEKLIKGMSKFEKYKRVNK